MKSTFWIAIIIIGACLALFETGQIGHLLTGVPAVVINLAVLFIAAVLIYKIVQKVVLLILVPAMLLLFVFGYFSIIVQAPIHGTVVDSNNKSIEGLVVGQEITVNGLMGNGSIWERNVTTTKDGYAFPWALHINKPFFQMFDKDEIRIDLCKEEGCPNKAYAEANPFAKIEPFITGSRFNFIPQEAALVVR